LQSVVSDNLLVVSIKSRSLFKVCLNIYGKTSSSIPVLGCVNFPLERLYDYSQRGYPVSGGIREPLPGCCRERGNIPNGNSTLERLITNGSREKLTAPPQSNGVSNFPGKNLSLGRKFSILRRRRDQAVRRTPPGLPFTGFNGY